MQKLIITGGNKLQGEVRISGAKNAALPIIFSSLLTDQPLQINNVPHLRDITTTIELISELGVHVTVDPFLNLEIQAKNIISHKAPYNLVRTMRASIMVLGPLLARLGEAVVSLPGGCAIGTRPVDLHVKGLQQLGAEINIENGYIHAKAPKGRLTGDTFIFERVSVTGTENLLMAAVLAKGTTVIKNAAKEPEVSDLCHFLNKMGAQISGIGSSTLIIDGVDSLNSATHTVIPDRIEAATYLTAAAITKGKIKLKDVNLNHFSIITDKFKEANALIETTENTITLDMRDRPLMPVNIQTSPYPGIPTDVQAQFTAMNAVAEGTSTIQETVFENRFMHIPELQRMGANLEIKGNTVICRGVPELCGAEVMATDLRASASLVIAALVANGKTVIHRIYHIDRGYECIEEKLSLLGADIVRTN